MALQQSTPPQLHAHRPAQDNEANAIMPYGPNTLYAILPDRTKADHALADLEAEGFPPPTATLFVGEDDAARLQPSGWPTRVFLRGRRRSQQAYADAVRRGRSVLSVAAADSERLDKVARLLAPHGATAMHVFDRFSVRRLDSDPVVAAPLG